MKRHKPTPFLVRLESVRGDEKACWIWPTRDHSRGYKSVWWNGRYWPAHRAAYTYLVGQIPDGLCLDHLCRNRACVNPVHLEPVTLGENVLRGTGRTARQKRQTHCKRGHELSGENLYTTKTGCRICKACQRLRERERNAADPEATKLSRAQRWRAWRLKDPAYRPPDPNKCKHGHDLTEENTKILYNGKRRCRTCDKARRGEYYSRKKERA